jgi:branched-chain amino acid transport system substrate-binding protein
VPRRCRPVRSFAHLGTATVLVRQSVIPAIAACAILVACGHTTSNGIVLGAAGPWQTSYGKADSLGIALAMDEINASDAWRGHPLRVVYRDDSASGAWAAAVAQQFVDSTSVVAVVGHVNSGAMMAAARVYDGHLPAIATSATSPDLTGISRWAFRVVSSDSANAQAIAQFVAKQGLRRAAVLYENNSYGRGLADAFRKSFKGEIVTFDPVDESGNESFEPFISFFKVQKPDVVFVATTDPPARAFMREAHRQQLTATIVGADGWMPLTADGALAEGVYVGAPFTATDTSHDAQHFIQAYRKRYGSDPDGYAALAYDATRIAAAAVEKVGPDRERVRDYLASLDPPFEGATGMIRFGPAGDPVGKGIVMTRIHDGALQVVRPGGTP